MGDCAAAARMAGLYGQQSGGALYQFWLCLCRLQMAPVHLIFVFDGPQRPLRKRGQTVTDYTPLWWEKPSQDILARIGEEGGADSQKASKLLLSELVCMTREEAARHHKEVFVEGKRLEDVYDRDVLERVASRRKEADEDERLT